MRRAIAQRMTESKTTIPHFYVETKIDMSSVMRRVSQLNADAESGRVTVTAALVRGCALALREHPQVNARWTEDGLAIADRANISIAIALDDGLVAPALIGAEDLDVFAIAIAIADMADRARLGKLRPIEISEGTFTLSNLGMFDVSSFTAIVTPPQVAVLAVARPVETLVLEAGGVVGKPILSAVMSADHRALDGADAARFLTTLKSLLESPTAVVPTEGSNV
jgi:pyruvate dehydrogenase E2 component (dihydrolipoamide acetyltransferase)